MPKDCKAHLRLSKAVFDGPPDVSFGVEGGEAGIFIEEPLDLGLRAEPDGEGMLQDGSVVRRSGAGLAPCPSPIDAIDWLWDVVEEPAPPHTLQRIPKGRYRVVMRYLPGPGFDGTEVCVAVSEAFEVLNDGVSFRIVEVE